MTQSLFVYGTLLPGLAPPAMRDLVGRMKPMGPASVRGSLYHLGAYPGLVLDASGSVIHGQLLEVPDDPALWLRMDSYEGFSPTDADRSLFRRVRATVTLPAADAVISWVYVYNGQPDAASLIPTGVWDPTQPSTSPRATMPQSNKPRRPLIGVTLGTVDGKPRYELPFDYATSIERAGGIPFPLAYRTDLSLIPEIVDRLDGVLFTGGNDLDPVVYGETFHPKAEPVDPDRQRFEMALIAEVERRRMPALGVCLGSQLMNVYRGGSLTQFLPEHDRPGALEHRKLNDDGRRHTVKLEEGTILAKAIGKPEITANTRHKQAIRTLGRGLRVNATAPDGVIEGIEDPTMPLFLAVQWHPENLSDQPEHLAPFKLLVERARG